VGPIIILDKSTFQSLSRREHSFLDKHFLQNLTPILAMEILGDLAKQPKKGKRSAEAQVAEISRKFGGSGPATNVDYLTLVFNCLADNPVPMEGRIIPESSRMVRAQDGSLGMIIDLSPFNRALLRWSRGEFSKFERELAKYWRQVTRSVSLDSFRDQLAAHRVILPQVDRQENLLPTVDDLLATATLQNVWLDWLLAQLSLPAPYEEAVKVLWRSRSGVLMSSFAPYAWHVLRVLLALVMATRHKLVTWDPTNVLDVQYLYYLPFCMVFTSDDQLHRFLAPLLIRKDQSFVVGRELKADLRKLADERDRLNSQERAMIDFALGSYPQPARDSVVHKLWKKHLRPWRPGSGNLVTSLPTPEQERAVRWVEQMFRDVEGNSYFEVGAKSTPAR